MPVPVFAIAGTYRIFHIFKWVKNEAAYRLWAPADIPNRRLSGKHISHSGYTSPHSGYICPLAGDDL